MDQNPTLSLINPGEMFRWHGKKSNYLKELAEYGINVYEIRPGVIETDMTSAVKEKYDRLIGEGLTPIKRWGKPDDVAKAVVAIAEDYFPFSTGEVINVDGGFHLRRL